MADRRRSERLPEPRELGCLRSLAAADEVCCAPCLPRRTSDESDPDLERIRLSLWRMRRAFDALGGRDAKIAITTLLTTVLPPATELRDIAIAWTDLIENMVQHAETTYGPRSGLGERKARLVKAAVLRFIYREHIELKGVPAYLQPILFDAGVGAAIDALCLIINRQSIWVLPPAPRAHVRLEAFTWLQDLVRRWQRWMLEISWRFVLWANPVDPHVEASIKALTSGQADLLGRTVKVSFGVLEWLGTNSKVFLALIDLATTAVNEAEGLVHMTGPEKRDYAIRFIVEFLIEEGLVSRDGLSRDIAEALLGDAIELIVHLFNKRGSFTSHAASPKTPALRPAPAAAR